MPRGLPQRRRERGQAPGTHSPGHHAVPNGRVLRVLLLQIVREPDLAFRKRTKTGRRPGHRDQRGVHRRAYVRFLFADGARDPPANPAAAADHAQKLFEHIDAP